MLSLATTLSQYRVTGETPRLHPAPLSNGPKVTDRTALLHREGHSTTLHHHPHLKAPITGHLAGHQDRETVNASLRFPFPSPIRVTCTHMLHKHAHSNKNEMILKMKIHYPKQGERV